MDVFPKIVAGIGWVFCWYYPGEDVDAKVYSPQGAREMGEQFLSKQSYLQPNRDESHIGEAFLRAAGQAEINRTVHALFKKSAL